MNWSSCFFFFNVPLGPTNIKIMDLINSQTNVKVGNDQEMTQSESNSHSKNRGEKQLTIRY